MNELLLAALLNWMTVMEDAVTTHYVTDWQKEQIWQARQDFNDVIEKLRP